MPIRFKAYNALPPEEALFFELEYLLFFWSLRFIDFYEVSDDLQSIFNLFLPPHQLLFNYLTVGVEEFS